jgi:indole-3-glycerol phosphate synthase
MLTDLLPAMVASARRSAIERARGGARRDVERQAAARQPRGEAFGRTLRAPGIRIIAECKRRSPSRGVLRSGYDPADIARGYEAAGAAAISVLTDAAFFDGSLDHLRAVREVTGVPLLRKDFIVSEFQLVEARGAGADAALLIVAALGDEDLAELIRIAASLDLAALVEVHEPDELTRALDAGAVTIGVNSRNLRTLDVQPLVFDSLIQRMPDGVVAVAESGLKTADDVRRLRAAGYNAFLMGERFMAAPDPGAALSELWATASTTLEERR